MLLFSSDQIQQHIIKVATLINNDYKNKEFTALVILKGGVSYATHLLELVTVPCDTEYIQASSYSNEKISQGSVKFSDFDFKLIEGKEVLIIDDILETGKTISTLFSHLCWEGAKNVRVTCLFQKEGKLKFLAYPDYPTIKVDSDMYIYGFGLDLKGKFRNLTEVYGEQI